MTACQADEGNSGQDTSLLDVVDSDSVSDKSDTSEDSDGDDDPADGLGGADSIGPSDAEHPDVSDALVIPEIPDQITTEGAEFEGVIPANGSLELDLVANKDDLAVIWLRVEGDEAWRSGLSLYPSGSNNSLVYSTPQNAGEDAHIPYQNAAIESGWEFRDGGVYRLELANLSDTAGRFRFTLECLGGPCDTSDPGDTNNDPGDVDPGENPYTDLNNAALKSALQATHDDHYNLGYDDARDFLFEYEMANVGAVGQIEGVYTGRTAFVDDRRDAQSQHDYNTEHTWPQSRGASGLAKSDMHHLFIADGPANSRRSNHFFDTVVDASWSGGGSKLGANAAGETRFEPRDVHKGNVARALFYFSVVYEYQITADEESALRQWMVVDPVDAAERARNDAIDGVQHSRNFFVDWPELVDQIDDF